MLRLTRRTFAFWMVGISTALGTIDIFGIAKTVYAQSLQQQHDETSSGLKTAWQPKEGSWTPQSPKRLDIGKIKVIWLKGTPYEMGVQQGTFLKKEIGDLGREVLNGLSFAGRGLGLSRLATRRSFPGVVEECEGMVSVAKDVGMTMDACMVLSFGDVFQEYLSYLLPKALFNDGCAHFLTAGSATPDNGFYQGWTLDNNSNPLPYWIDNPVIQVRQPNDGIPHVAITIPGVGWPNAGFNAEGLIISNNTSHPKNYEDLDVKGKSTVQLMAYIIKNAGTYDEARAIMETYPRMRSNLVIITDAKSRKAGVFELLGKEMGIRELPANGVLYMTNHFASAEMLGRDASNQSSHNRFKSFQQLLAPDGSRSKYGQFTPQTILQVLRDRTNPNTMESSPTTVYDDNASIGGNGSLRQVIFDPERLMFWVANGEVPIPNNPFTCFSMGEMLGLTNAVPCPSPSLN
ncbi:C45 family autoproteolytic acyltransferase/hydolase [Lyngbya confervoides]|uniref:C45 family peptidase n=1 Tax=Lyngbya confervoides BDU141951 TaxID=1574623 RepID=A0ABD4T8J6_9CYAN|nr:C45 family peptidase [Lyngbya confervoides]MCM1984966.1 C45 family peptidase [Lyngbya confervoides BDU141951]